MDTNSAEFKAALRDHAKSLDVSPDADVHLMALVEEALLAEIPDGWEQGETEDGTLYYFNTNTEESIWEHPLDAHYRDLIATKKQEHVDGKFTAAAVTTIEPKQSSAVAAKDEFVAKPVPTTSAISSVEVYSFDEDSDDDGASTTTASKANACSKDDDKSLRISSLFNLQPAPSFSSTSALMAAKKDAALGATSSASSTLSAASKSSSGLGLGSNSSTNGNTGGGGGFGRDRSWLLDGDDDDDVEIPTLGKASTTATTTPAPYSSQQQNSSTTSADKIDSFGGRDRGDDAPFGSSKSSFASGIASRGARGTATSSLSGFSSRMYGSSGTSPSTMAGNTGSSSSLASGSITSLDSTSPTQSKAGSPRRVGIGSSIKGQFFQEMTATTPSDSSASSAGSGIPGTSTTSLPGDIAKIQQLEKRVSELTKQNDQLSSDFEKTRQQLDQAQLEAKESNYLKMKANESKTKLAEKDAEIQKLAQDHAASVSKLQQEIQQSKSENDRLSKNQMQQASSSTQEVMEMRQSFAAVQAEKAALQKELSDLEQKLRDAQQEVTKYQQQTQNHVARIAKLEATLERERNEHSSEIGALRDNLEQKRKGHDAELQARRKDHELELEQLRSQLETLKREITDKERRTESLGILQDTLERQTKFLKEMEEKNKELQSRLTAAEEKESSALREVKAREQDCSDTIKKLGTVQMEVEAKEKQIATLSEKLRVQIDQMASLEAKSAGFLRQEDDFKRERASAERERRDLTNEFKDKNEELQKLQSQMRKAQDEHLTVMSKLQMESQELQNQIKAIKMKEVLPLEKQCEQLRRDNERLSERLALQDKEHQQTKSELASSGNEIHQLHVEIETWKRKEQQQKAQKDMYCSEKTALEKHATSLEAEHSSYKNAKRLEIEKLSFRMRELESQIAQKDYEILRVEERFTKAEAWRLKEARRVEERDSQLLDVKEELAQLKNRNVEAENNVVIQELRRDREQLQHRIAQFTQELEEEKVARQVSGQKFHDELSMMQKGLEWQLPQLAAACVNRSSEEWVRKCHQVVKALRDDFNMKALTERNELLGKVKSAENARDHVEQKYKNVLSECDFLRKEVHRVEDNNKVLLDQLHTIRVYMTQRSMPASMTSGFPAAPSAPQSSSPWGHQQHSYHHPGTSNGQSPPPPPPPPPAFGVPFTDFSTINHLNTQLGILHSQFQQLFDATERRPPGISIPRASSQHHHHFSPSDRFEIPVSPPSASAKHQNQFRNNESSVMTRSASPTTNSRDLDQTMDVLLDQALESKSGNRTKDFEHEKEQLISTLEAIGLSGASPAQLVSAANTNTTTTSLVLDDPHAAGSSAWYQKDYWRSKYQ